GSSGGREGMSYFIDQSEIRQLLKEQGIEVESGGGGGAVVGTESASAEELAKGLNSGEARSRAQAAARLAESPDAKSVLHLLIRALGDSDRNVRREVGNAIQQRGPPERGDIQPANLRYLRACLRDETATGEMHRWAMKAIALLGENAKPAAAEITALVKSDDKETRLAALTA